MFEPSTHCISLIAPGSIVTNAAAIVLLMGKFVVESAILTLPP